MLCFYWSNESILAILLAISALTSKLTAPTLFQLLAVPNPDRVEVCYSPNVEMKSHSAASRDVSSESGPRLAVSRKLRHCRFEP